MPTHLHTPTRFCIRTHRILRPGRTLETSACSPGKQFRTLLDVEAGTWPGSIGNTTVQHNESSATIGVAIDW